MKLPAHPSEGSMPATYRPRRMTPTYIHHWNFRTVLLGVSWLLTGRCFFAAFFVDFFLFSALTRRTLEGTREKQRRTRSRS